MPTKYETGVWYGWNGGECPVHPNSVVEVRNLKRGEIKNSEIYSWVEAITERAGWFDAECWQGVDSDTTNPIVAFRVVKEYRQPLEVWIAVYGPDNFMGAFPTEQEARLACPSAIEIKRFREVTEYAQ